MDAKTLFDAEVYFSGICAKNRLAASHRFHFCTCSGIDLMQGPLARFRTEQAFFCVDDTNDGVLFQGRSGGWFKKRTFTVFIVHRFRADDMADRSLKMDICRSVFRQVASRMIVDADDLKNDLVYLHVDNILSREFGRDFMNDCTGLYFMIDVSEPVDLQFDESEWMH